jgi:hypothetical protein
MLPDERGLALSRFVRWGQTAEPQSAVVLAAECRPKCGRRSIILYIAVMRHTSQRRCNAAATLDRGKPHGENTT